MSIEEKIIKAIGAHKQIGISGISRETGVRVEDLVYVLERLVREGKIERIGSGKTIYLYRMKRAPKKVNLPTTMPKAGKPADEEDGENRAPIQEIREGNKRIIRFGRGWNPGPDLQKGRSVIATSIGSCIRAVMEA